MATQQQGRKRPPQPQTVEQYALTYQPPEPRKGTPIPAWPFLNRRESDRDATFDDPGYV